MFTGSTAVAKLIHHQLAERSVAREVPLIAETGGLNALIADSSALVEQVVADVIASAFDSAGQRCSALRILCLQEDVADAILTMLKGAMHELRVGNPARLATDIGPVISAEARDNILQHIETMRGRGHAVTCLDLPAETSFGTFAAPTIIEVNRVTDVEREVFGPVLHVVRYRRQDLDSLIDDINASGYGLTFGLHTRIDETIARVVDRVRAGNIYVNRNVIGAVVGVQPFGGLGLSGTGPKAGGPLYLGRLLTSPPDRPLPTIGAPIDLPGPVGERNSYTLRPRGLVACVATSEAGLRAQLDAARATGNRAVVVGAGDVVGPVDAVLFQGDAAARHVLSVALARRQGPIIPLLAVSSPSETYDLNRLFVECAISVNTAAAGGNATLMSIG
jgi:RHH-type proline utilization regulon transcriptional repressor/proline dehydrogenase/delta 1-pyrroline-5-carboxylate dehydrogenase